MDHEEHQPNNAWVISEFRKHCGKVGGRFAGANLLILHTTGAKSGRERLTPLVYLVRDGRRYVFAAGPGLSHHPAWYRNLLAHPGVTVEVGSETVSAVARVLKGDARSRLWEQFVAEIPKLPGWQRDAHRQFPIIELTSLKAFNEKVIAEFRANDGEVSNLPAAASILLLTTTGARSGQKRTSPLGYLVEGDHYYINGAYRGAPRHPAWYRNILAHPEVTVEVGSGTFDATARVLTGSERQRIWDRWVARLPRLADWQRTIEREIPIIELTSET